jgi:hypothetical protein
LAGFGLLAEIAQNRIDIAYSLRSVIPAWLK